MKILGTLTTYGEQLYAESVTNGTKVEITRIAAGSGETPLTNEYITDHEMYLTLSSEVVDGETIYYGLLNMASASESFTLREIGLYTTQSIVRLYKLYRLTSPIEIDNTQDHTIRFTFRDVDISHEIFNGYAMPESIVTYEILNERMGALIRYIDETVSYSCSSASVDAVIASIPKCVEKNYVINLTGSSTDSIKLEGFYGKGSITIVGYDNAQTSAESYTRIEGGISIKDCTAKIVLSKLRLVCTSYYDSSLDIYRCTNVIVSHCALGAASEAYIARVYGSTVFYECCFISETKGSGVLTFNESSHIRWSYKKAEMFDRAFIDSGTAFVRVNSRSDITFLDELTESGLGMLTVTVNQGFYITQTGKGTEARVRVY
ncbi:MAG: hypothetical protein IJO16_08475 [Clostridia bacterium]|nr:hypothetical protein [Clostridia bacterium]